MKHYTIKEFLDLSNVYDLIAKVYINNLLHNYKIYDNILLIERQTYNKNIIIEININTNEILTNTFGKINFFKFDCLNYKSHNLIVFDSEEKYNHIIAKPVHYYNISSQDRIIISSLTNDNTIIHENYQNKIILNYYTPIEDIDKTLNNLLFL